MNHGNCSRHPTRGIPGKGMPRVLLCLHAGAGQKPPKKLTLILPNGIIDSNFRNAGSKGGIALRTKAQEDLIRILRAELTGEDGVTDIDRDGVCRLARQHQVEHIVSHALLQNGHKEHARPLHQSIWMSEQQVFVLDQVRAAFNHSQIPFIPLKGSVLRTLYPQGWMRNSCDIDVLVRECDMERAGAALLELGCQKSPQATSHDISFTAGPVHVELHHSLMGELRIPRMAAVLAEVWERAYIRDGSEYAMEEEMFFFYHIAHMVKHFRYGGCGIRSFMDLWILNHRVSFDRDRRAALLERGGILTFAEAACQLSEHWFSDTGDAGPAGMEAFVLTGGAYGTVANSLIVQKTLRGGKWRQILSRIFVSPAHLKRRYPAVERHPGLWPVYQVVRWIQALTHKGRYAREWDITMQDAPEAEQEVAELLTALELLPY